MFTVAYRSNRRIVISVVAKAANSCRFAPEPPGVSPLGTVAECSDLDICVYMKNKTGEGEGEQG